MPGKTSFARLSGTYKTQYRKCVQISFR